MPGGEHQHAVDHDGEAAVAILRAIGLPMTVVAVQGGGGDGAGTSAPAGMKERSAAKRRAEKAVTAQVRLSQRKRNIEDGAYHLPTSNNQIISQVFKGINSLPVSSDCRGAPGVSRRHGGGLSAAPEALDRASRYGSRMAEAAASTYDPSSRVQTS